MYSHRLVISVILAVAIPTCGYGYNKAGHMVSGAMAYRILREDNPEIVAKAIALLRQMPDYDQRWKPQIDKAPVECGDICLFMLAARWPDDIRGDKQYDHPEWHYINLGFKPVGQPASVRVQPPAYENILRAYDNQRHELQSDATDAEKAIALCWMYHLIGDVHLPVHCTTLFTSEYPDGDRGATRFFIKPREHSAATSLHYYWDDLVLRSESFEIANSRAIELLARPRFAPERLHELRDKRFENWAKAESCVLAREAVYRQGQLAGSPDLESAPILPEDYADIAKEIAERRMVLAGYRLADVLRECLK